ncbi:protein piccolo-like [Eleginops maclovinus]|uniref:protein piccolo-like n=1 Tax=Eleginops maclovinus TaxID=56733 RepID=UPI0030801324
MDEMQPDSAGVPQIVTPTRQGHVVIIVPSVENISLLGKTPQDLASTESIHAAASLPQGSEKASEIPSTDIASLLTKVSAVPVASAPPLPPKPLAGANVVETVEIPVAGITPPLPITLPKPSVYPKPLVPTAVTTGITTVGHVFDTTGPCQIAKPPPPIPPKPVSIPAGLVFSHKPGESVKPPPPYVAHKAATLPRAKEPPNALSLSLTRPVESKLGATSPKSPLSPRHAKSLQTYVVITLPSEPGSPTEVITVQAPVRRSSIPSTQVSGASTSNNHSSNCGSRASDNLWRNG